MPLYEYKCSGCGKTFEVIQKFTDEPLKTHPECGGPVERLLSAPALQFKGSGWYVTDYGKGGEKTTNGSSKSDGGSDAAKSGSDDKKSVSDSSSSGSKSSESKPATSSESKSSSTSSTSNTK